jgi:excisionase family DNA binding protein
MPGILQDRDIETPGPAEIELARETCRKLAPFVQNGDDLKLQIGTGREREELVLPQHVAEKLLAILTEVGRGNAVQVTALQPEITTREAAELLNVSQAYVVKLIDEGALSCREVGPRQLIVLDDVIDCKKRLYGERLQALNELTRFSEELGLYGDDGQGQ